MKAKKVKTEHEALVKDIVKGQSMQMLSYLYKMKPYRIQKIAREYGLKVFSPNKNIFMNESHLIGGFYED